MDLNRQIYGRYTPEEWVEYCWMPQVRINETPAEWKERIWGRLTYFKENDLLPIESKKYFNARKLIRFPDGSSYAPTIGIAICLSCNELVYTGKSIKTIESHWKAACTGNKYCELKYGDFLKIKHKHESDRTFDDTRALHYYELWISNAIRRLKRAREVGKKIQACIKIQRKILEWIYRPDGFDAQKLSLH
ncbi:1189_t:CDS:1 [Paraglomus occultum]|uniref:1189_t:CDS:1 n=1 Tax=Paraglomus occultum TaxID=144539 RepID=A0A9N9GBU4_9GLOM|nr:1189_t:CDS:1 [Paraglomus occultum]